ncbi:twin-arginine translocation signal domain-containing protein [Nannocystis pusilla]
MGTLGALAERRRLLVEACVAALAMLLAVCSSGP